MPTTFVKPNMKTTMQEVDDSFEWIERIIESCYNDFHIEAVDKLIELYFQRTKNEKNYNYLQIMRWVKYNEIHFIL